MFKLKINSSQAYNIGILNASLAQLDRATNF